MTGGVKNTQCLEGWNRKPCGAVPRTGSFFYPPPPPMFLAEDPAQQKQWGKISFFIDIAYRRILLSQLNINGIHLKYYKEKWRDYVAFFDKC